MTINYAVVSLALALMVNRPATAGQLGGKPAILSGPYQTEQAWAAGEIAADIAEMAALAAPQPRPAAVPAPAGVTPWMPEQWVAFAGDRLAPAPAKAASSATLPPQYPLLTELTPAALVRASASVSAALKRDMRAAAGHESAALVLGAFGLREAAAGLSDVRWVLNRMTAHLAVAAALRDGNASPSIDGQLAHATLLALSDRDASTLAALAQIPDLPSDAARGAWLRGLRMRATQDWRVTPQPATASRLEKLEYFRARRSSMRLQRAGEELTGMREPVAADFARILQSFSWGVEDGNDFVRPALALELMEFSDVHRLVRGKPLPSDLPSAVVNVRATRLAAPGGPQVIPWGAWAEYFQRHIGLYIGQIDHLHRRMLGTPAVADQVKAALDTQFGHLALFPVATAQRTRGRGTEADLTYLRPAIDLAIRAPELVTYDFWTFLDMGSRYEMVAYAMPSRTPWFAIPTAAMPYEAGTRTVDTIGRIPLPALEALVAEASSDKWLMSRALRPRPKNQALVDLVFTLLRARNAYDLWAIDVAVNGSRDNASRITWRRYGCSLSANQCLSLAALLANTGDEAGAAAEYERVFKDPALDQVAMSNSSAWLVRYYERNRQIDRALDLAERSAEVGSARGLITLARFYERRGRADEARPLFERLAGRYERSGDELLGFLHRQVVVRGRTSEQAEYARVLHAAFPGGLTPVPAAMPAQPAKGVFINRDSAESQRLRLQAGDIIVGVDGWLVQSKEQYQAIMALADDGVKHKITAWRGVLFTVEADEDIGMELETFPLAGWIK